MGKGSRRAPPAAVSGTARTRGGPRRCCPSWRADASAADRRSRGTAPVSGNLRPCTGANADAPILTGSPDVEASRRRVSRCATSGGGPRFSPPVIGYERSSRMMRMLLKTEVGRATQCSGPATSGARPLRRLIALAASTIRTQVWGGNRISMSGAESIAPGAEQPKFRDRKSSRETALCAARPGVVVRPDSRPVRRGRRRDSVRHEQEKVSPPADPEAPSVMRRSPHSSETVR